MINDTRQLKLEAALKRVRLDSELNEENRGLLLKFADKCIADGLSVGRISKLLYVLRYLSRFLGKQFKKAKKDDIQRLIVKLEQNPNYSEWSRYDFKVILKKFYKWLRGNDEMYPDEVRWIKPRIKNGNRTLPEELVTEDEVKLLIGAATHPRDNAFVQVLYESGCRIGELLSMCLKNVQFDEYGAVLRVTGKTGDRRVRIVSSSSALATWMDSHPKKGDPDAPLWIALLRQYHYKPFSYNTAFLLLRKLAKRAGVNKHIYPHLFRHSRATSLASKLTEAQMKELFGWVQSSKMASVYVHLSGRDVDNAVLGLYGLKNNEKEVSDNFKPKICGRCDHKNSPVSKFCSKCGLAFDIESAIQLDEKVKDGDEIMNLLMRNDEFRQIMVGKIIELGLDKKMR